MGVEVGIWPCVAGVAGRAGVELRVFAFNAECSYELAVGHDYLQLGCPVYTQDSLLEEDLGIFRVRTFCVQVRTLIRWTR